MTDIEVLKTTRACLNEIKDALDELKSKDNIDLTISINGKPIDEFSGNLEKLNLVDLITPLNDLLGNIDSMTTGNNESAGSNESI